MKKLVWDNNFRRAFKKQTRHNPRLKAQIFDVLERLSADPFHPSLRTHKLKGTLEGLWACWVEYDCRIIFLFDVDPAINHEEVIVLVDIGSHDEVY